MFSGVVISGAYHSSGALHSAISLFLRFACCQKDLGERLQSNKERLCNRVEPFLFFEAAGNDDAKERLRLVERLHELRKTSW